ncbi:polyketide biosynthesis protein [Litorivita pollutaquae]|uniref:Polyketide biosynthesis protein n=1 Tax=Litorivita pollutaquae TaxID=2200892 RepID=A0A2V4NEJ1_9RHOB|nr:DsbA family oxidoreductase [Litorivita pollutaquae]OUS21858.1 polyketide biosynthesis protein [Rhodobacterales bacterium 59_46_T64]PYC48330.1 polyketide biosynthesis protein [Litorivita pollutaquae]
MVKLDIISDPICPWCFIGKTLLDRALEARPDHPFVIEWHPFQLNPDMPVEGMERRAYLEAKFGGAEGADKTYGAIADHAKEAGVEIDFDAITRTPNTFNAHRLIHWAQLEGRQTAVVSRLFKAYFQEGRDIGNADVLADIADGVGIDASVVLRLFDSDADRDTLTDRETQFRKMGVTSVPTFIVASQHAVPGAQPTELWLQVMDDIAAQARE